MCRVVICAIIFSMRYCAKCGIEKTKENAGRDSHHKDGFNSFCKACKNQRGKESYCRHKDRINKKRTEKRHLDIETARAYGKRWRANNKAKLREINRLRRANNLEKVRAEAAKSQRKNREHRNEYKRKWREENKDRIKAMMPFSQKISLGISARIRNCIYGKKNGRPWESIVGFTLKELIEHLEKNFMEGMTWGNYGKFGWHIDHIKPISFFAFTTADDKGFRACWSLTNLQPLWAKDNLTKGAKV